MEKALFLAAFFFAYTVQAITGFAGNIFAMPVGTTLLGLSPTVSILNAMGFFACGLLAVLNIKHVNWREFGKIIAVMIVFMVVGIWLDTLMPVSYTHLDVYKRQRPTSTKRSSTSRTAWASAAASSGSTAAWLYSWPCGFTCRSGTPAAAQNACSAPIWYSMYE